MSDSPELERAGPGELAGRQVVVLGLGLFGGGAGAARWALERGAHTVVTDLRTEEELQPSIESLHAYDGAHGAARLSFTLGRHDDHELASADLVIVNPAVPPHAPSIAAARRGGAQVTTAIALLLKSTRARVVAVTGTHGKSSTARFIATLAESTLKSGTRVALGGNIGGSLLHGHRALGPDDVLVLELSSYQLEHLPRSVERVLDGAVITQLGVDHIARHSTVANYHAAKLRVFDYLVDGGFAVVDESVTEEQVLERQARVSLARRAPGGKLEIDPATQEVRLDGQPLGSGRDLAAEGAHQKRNLALALATVRFLGAPADALARAVRKLAPPPHRIEPLGLHRSPGAAPFVVFDNGVSTTPESTLGAMEALGHSTRPPRVLLAGGQSKRGLELRQIAQYAEHHDWMLFGFGASAGEFEAGAAGTTLEEALERAVAALNNGGCLLFSPACASFDGYANFQERAQAFRSALGHIASPLSALAESARD